MMIVATQPQKNHTEYIADKVIWILFIQIISLVMVKVFHIVLIIFITVMQNVY